MSGMSVQMVVLFVLGGIFVPLDTSVARANARVKHKASDLAWMKSVAPQLAAVLSKSAW